jgi:hypothetical protein
VLGSCEHGSDHSGSVKDGEFLDHTSECQLITKIQHYGDMAQDSLPKSREVTW